MTDLSTWELRDLEGYEWIMRPERTSGVDGYPWQGVYREANGEFRVSLWDDEGFCSWIRGSDLVPPEPDWRHVRLLDGLLMQETRLTIATHRYDANTVKKGEPIVLEPIT